MKDLNFSTLLTFFPQDFNIFSTEKISEKSHQEMISINFPQNWFGILFIIVIQYIKSSLKLVKIHAYSPRKRTRRLTTRGQEALKIDNITCMPCEDFLKKLTPSNLRI
jgi:hypothetical protein